MVLWTVGAQQLTWRSPSSNPLGFQTCFFLKMEHWNFFHTYAKVEPAEEKSNKDNPDRLRVTRSSKRKGPLYVEEREDIELVDPLVRKSRRLTSQKECKRKQQICKLKFLNASFLQRLSNSDVTGTLNILKEARHGKCSFTQNTLDTAFISASRQGFLFVMQSLLYLGANIESTDADGNTALMFSVERKSVDMVKFLLKKGANAKAVRKSTGDSCLLLAVQPEGLSQIVELLIDHGANIHSQNKNGDTALIRAFNFGNVKVIHLLLKSGANAERCNKFGKTARSMANSVGLSRILASMSNIKKEVPALVKAVEMKDIWLLEILLDNKVENVDALYWESNVSTTALELAFEKIGFKPPPDPATSQIFERMIKLLLKEGAKVNRHTESRDIADCPLFVAVKAGRCDLVNLLIHYGAKRLTRAFQCALLVGKTECARLLFDKGVKGDFKKLALRVVSTREVDSFRFLHDRCRVKASDPRLIHTAVIGGHINMVRLLIELGADVNARCEGYAPILHHVKDLAMAALLVDNGADVNAVKCSFSSCDYDEVPLTVAIKQSKTDLMKFYLFRGANIFYNLSDRGLPVLQCLCDNPSGELLDLFLSEGMNINYRNKDGNTTLMWAVLYRKLDLLKLLIDKGADVNLANAEGVSPLMNAVRDCTYHFDGAVIECLINAGADVNRLDSCGNSALIYCAKAIWNGTEKTLKLLLEKGANVNIQNQEKETVLSVLSFNSFEKVKILLEAGADVNSTDKNGCTPLMNFVSRTHVLKKEDLQIFLDHGAPVNFVGSEEGFDPRTALSISFRKWIRQRGVDHSDRDDGSGILNLLEAGADPSLTPLTKSLLHWAILFNQRSIIPTLVTSGLSPYECDDNTLRGLYRLPRGYGSCDTVSPFILALSLGRLSIAKFLADVSFFTEKDIGQGYGWAQDLRGYVKARGYLQTLAYVDEFKSRPRSLTDLSSLVISYNLEDASDKRRAIMSFELPLSLQHRLLYQHTRGRLESGIDETAENQQYNLNLI